MKRRVNEAFLISFLDLLTCALASVFMLFIIVPKGNTFSAKPDVEITSAKMDSVYKRIDMVLSGKDTISKVDIQKVRFFLLKLKVQTDSVRDIAIYYRNKSKELENGINTISQKLKKCEEDKSKLCECKPVKVQVPIPLPPPTTKPEPPIVKPQPKDTSKRQKPDDPGIPMKDPFVFEVNWRGKADIDLLLMDATGQNFICRNVGGGCRGKYAKIEASGRRDTIQYERITVVSRNPERYEVRVAIFNRPGFGSRESSVNINGHYFVKPNPNTSAYKVPFKRTISTEKRGGKPGIAIGILEVTADNVKFIPNKE